MQRLHACIIVCDGLLSIIIFLSSSSSKDNERQFIHHVTNSSSLKKDPLKKLSLVICTKESYTVEASKKEYSREIFLHV